MSVWSSHSQWGQNSKLHFGEEQLSVLKFCKFTLEPLWLKFLVKNKYVLVGPCGGRESTINQGSACGLHPWTACGRSWTGRRWQKWRGSCPSSLSWGKGNWCWPPPASPCQERPYYNFNFSQIAFTSNSIMLMRFWSQRSAFTWPNNFCSHCFLFNSIWINTLWS